MALSQLSRTPEKFRGSNRAASLRHARGSPKVVEGIIQNEVLQVGDVAGVATTLTQGLREFTEWSVREVVLPPPSAQGIVGHALETPGRGFRARGLVRSAVRQKKPSVIHVHWARYAPFIGSRGSPTVVHAHGSDVRGRSTSLSGRVVLKSLNRAQAVLVSTPDLLDDVGPRGTYLPNPIDTRYFSPTASPPASDGRPTFLIFSQLIDVKGAPTLLAAARILTASIPDARVIALRGGTYDDEAVTAGLEMLPRQTRAQLIELLARADVVIGQLALGSLGLSELESMACAKPVVTFLRDGLYPSDVPVISASSADEVAHECAVLLADGPRRIRIGRLAREYVTERHDTQVVVGQLIKIYEGLM